MTTMELDKRINDLTGLARMMRYVLRKLELQHEESPGNYNDTSQCCPICHKSPGHASGCSLAECYLLADRLGVQ